MYYELASVEATILAPSCSPTLADKAEEKSQEILAMVGNSSMLGLVLTTILSTFAGSFEEVRATSATTIERPAPRLDFHAAEDDHAAVTLDGKFLFGVRGFHTFPAAERAKVVSQRSCCSE